MLQNCINKKIFWTQFLKKIRLQTVDIMQAINLKLTNQRCKIVYFVQYVVVHFAYHPVIYRILLFIGIWRYLFLFSQLEILKRSYTYVFNSKKSKIECFKTFFLFVVRNYNKVLLYRWWWTENVISGELE